MRVALLTVGNAAASGEKGDLCGPLLHKLVAEGGRTVVRAEIVGDDRQAIKEWLCRAADVHRVDLVLTSGGTSLSPLHVTPEATRDALDREAPGIAEAIRSLNIEKTMLSRNVAGIRKKTLIINLTGSPKSVTEQWVVIESVIEQAVTMLQDEDPSGRFDVRDAQAPVIIDHSKPEGTWHNTLVGQPVEEVLSDLEKKK